MPGLKLWYEQVAADVGPDQVPPQLLANSQTIYPGDPVVWTSVTGSQNRVRKLTATDISNLYQVTGSVAGILGFAPAGVATDASGNITTLAAPVSLTGRQVIYPAPSVALFEPIDPVSGRAMSSIFSTKNWIAGNLWESTTVTKSLIGTAVGIVISTLTGEAARFFWSSGAATKVGRIVEVDVQDPLFNTAVNANVQDTTHSNRAIVVVKLYTSMDQFDTNVIYAD